MFKAISSIFSSKSGEKVIDGIYNGVDYAFFTEEEKAEAKQKKIQSKISLLGQFEAFKIAQRIIAVTLTINFILAFWVAVGIFIFSTPLKLESFIQLMGVFNIGWIMTAIVAWYFSGGVIESIKKK